MIKIYLKSYLYLFISILSLTIIFTTINYILPTNTNFIKLFIPLISIIISTIILGKKVTSKAYLEGIKFTSIYIIFSLIIFIIFNNSFKITLILIYLLELLIGIIGSKIGINLNKKS